MQVLLGGVRYCNAGFAGVVRGVVMQVLLGWYEVW